MLLYSTSNPGITATFCEAVEQGIAADGGLFMPRAIPRFPEEFFRRLDRMSFPDIAFAVTRFLLQEEIPDRVLHRIVAEAMNFPVPVHRLDAETAVLELFHGPTLAFKDFGARFMARTLAYLRRGAGRECTVLVATSGDTGSAVAQGFHNVEGLNVVLLYPSGRVSKIQEQQLTTVGGNVTALEIEGTFDDCQRLVKEAFRHSALAASKQLTSANSINVARLIPQTLYYFEAFARWSSAGRTVLFSVPSGNLGNLTAGLMAWKMGLPVERFIAATNANDVFPRFLATGMFVPAPAVATLSNAMDVGNPSNLARITALFQGDLPAMRTMLFSAASTDEQTRCTIAEVFERYGYVMDPHGAVAYHALERYRKEHRYAGRAVVLETAHPAKFPEAYTQRMNEAVEIPERLRMILNGARHAVRLPADFEALKSFLLSS